MKASQAMLLARHELEALTGTKQAKRMHAWLAQRGWAHEPAARRGDTPKVDRTYYFDRMSGTLAPRPARVEPRFELVGAR